jgi:hypothetical protein
MIEKGKILFNGVINKLKSKNLNAHCPVGLVISSIGSIKLPKNTSATSTKKGLKSNTNNKDFCHFQETAPLNTWQDQADSEYGFYANVNPNVDHPRWSQARERVIGRGSFFSPEKRKTEMFNGYGKEVAHLYTGLDLTKNF